MTDGIVMPTIRVDADGYRRLLQGSAIPHPVYFRDLGIGVGETVVSFSPALDGQSGGWLETVNACGRRKMYRVEFV